MNRILILVLAVLMSATSLLAQGTETPPNSTSRMDGSSERAASIEGQVSLPDGSPAPYVYLRLEPEGAGGMLQSASTDSSGNFSFSGATVGSNYNITGSVPGFQPVSKLVMITGQLSYVNITLIALPGTNAAASAAMLKKQAPVPPKAIEQYNKGLQDLDQGKASDAESAFKKAVKIYPEFANSYLRLSAIYADQNRFPDAEDAIHHAEAIDKGNPDNYAYLGYLYMKQKQPDKAQQSFEKSVQMAPNDWFAQLEMGRLLYDQKGYKDALPHLELAHKLHPQAASVHLLLYDDLIRLNDRKGALAELDDFVARFPNSHEAAQMKKVRPALAAAAAGQH
jgi:tetratricopeptide (TPR) repeat protein